MRSINQNFFAELNDSPKWLQKGFSAIQHVYIGSLSHIEMEAEMHLQSTRISVSLYANK